MCGTRGRERGQIWNGPLAVGQKPGFSLPLTCLYDHGPVPSHQRAVLTFIKHLYAGLGGPTLVSQCRWELRLTHRQRILREDSGSLSASWL